MPLERFLDLEHRIRMGYGCEVRKLIEAEKAEDREWGKCLKTLINRFERKDE